MGGAFIGVADDASAVFWNPAGLAAGAYLQPGPGRRTGDSTPDDGSSAAIRLARWPWARPPLGLSYYR